MSSLHQTAAVNADQHLSRASLAGASQPVVVIGQGQTSWRDEVRAIWEFRELLYFMVWKEVKTRYKQTALGVGWAVLQPLLTTVIFTVVFSYFARISSDGIPYPLFALSGLLPWTYFSQALTRSSVGVVANANLISKVYFPRLILPISSAITPLIDFALTFTMLIGLMVWYGVPPTGRLLFLPAFVFMAFFAALSISLWLSALNVRYRDVGHLIPFLTQIWMYASPVVYPSNMVPESWRYLYGMNPMLPAIEGFRWALIGAPPPDGLQLVLSIGVSLAIMAAGLAYFKAAERTLADVI